MSNMQLIMTMLFVVLAMLLSRWRELNLERDILWSTVRAGLQLLAIGYVLHLIFAAHHVIFTFLIVLVMIIVAAYNVAGKARQRMKVFRYVFVALLVAEAIGVGLLTALHIIETTAQYVIPISGMLIGNAMVAASLQWNRMRGEMKNRVQEVEVFLAMGFSSQTASAGLVKKTIQASLIPTIESMKTMGLVQLPGMMTGQIIAGANPIEAVKYQILIVFTMTATSSLCAILLGAFLYRVFFTREHQLHTEEF